MRCWQSLRLKSDSQLYELGTTALRRLSRINHRRDEVVEGGGGIIATTGVDGGGLDDGAARGDEPVKTLALRKQADRARALAAATDGWNAG